MEAAEKDDEWLALYDQNGSLERPAVANESGKRRRTILESVEPFGPPW
jgi:hypothetical protein